MNTAVYYPHFCPTAEWLRRAALLWDQVYVLDPVGTLHSPEVERLDEALGGVLQRVDPWRLGEPEVSNLVLDGLGNWLELRAREMGTRATSEESFRELETLLPRTKVPEGPVIDMLKAHGVLQVEEQTVDVELPVWEVDEFYARYMESPMLISEPAPGSDHEKYEALSRRWQNAELKGDVRKAERLRAKAEAIRSRNLTTVQDHSTSYRLPTGVAREYLALCAAGIAAADGRDVVSAGEPWIEPVMSSDPALRGEVAFGLLELVLPEDIDTIADSDLATFRAESATKRLTWQAEIQQLVDTYAAAASVDSYLRVREQLIELANERVEETKRLYRSANLRTATEALSISLTPPALATFAASALGIGLIGPIGLSAALSLIAAERVLEWRSVQRAHRNSPWSYVLDITDLST